MYILLLPHLEMSHMKAKEWSTNVATTTTERKK